ncbi:BlaI/MecI/CopY family transcriptional regulator [Streptosporangium sp. NBC_01755]|uniref:BlaI/MecI/CopY family transcriptional regulator n=1 Tax=unclassified Streptosporangium TaxID=2632669 RepID=UPI002DDC17FC|nr:MULTISPECIES: BlaI/MecI/CopY family transcriptional regulator [unclassified Streptosporangium]WSA25260.1 BlaI/MecI/CopY family transcriptional regulator [Streptosporangium sp. NBC_01810]WSD03423.1 BlaI/MecI/CopY family transcriptional regulator [Streptosporangium sp. NBC_01755]
MRGLGELESTIMERLWSYHRPASVREVLEDLRRDRDIAYTTVMTVMDKLHKKGLLRRKPVGRAYVYETVASKEAYTAELMRSSLASSGNQAATLVHFLERLTPEESTALEAALKVYPPGRRA